jgi:hypothetical protein
MQSRDEIFLDPEKKDLDNLKITSSPFFPSPPSASDEALHFRLIYHYFYILDYFSNPSIPIQQSIQNLLT